MIRVGLFYGSTDGNTAAAAQEIKRQIDAALAGRAEPVELLDVAEVYLDEMVDFDCLILGAPTWNTGQLQRDWDAVLPELDELDLTGKRAAVFGLGDQVGYPDTFADALFFVADKLRERGAELVGAWPADGYRFRSSWACVDGQFIGLVLDEHNQPELTPGRIERWVAQILGEFGLQS